MKKIVKKNYKILIGIVIGIIISPTIVYSAENILTTSDVAYSNGSSSADNVQKAIDDLYEKSNNTNIVAVYYYDETKGLETGLNELENKTNNWTNVNNLEYSIGKQDSTLGCSGCNGSSEWTATPYTLEKK